MTNRQSPTWEDEVDRTLALLDPDRRNARDGRGDEEAHQNEDVILQATPAEPPPESEREISVSQLHVEVFHSVRAGMALQEDIYDESGVLLLAAGSIITTRFLQLMRDRGITRVQLRKPASAPPEPDGLLITPPAKPMGPGTAHGPLHTRHSTELDERMPELLSTPLELRSVPTWRRPRMTISDLKAEAERTVQSHKQTSLAVADLCQTLGTGRRVSSREVQAAVARFVDKAAVDFDLLPLVVSLRESGDEYLFDHCVSVALMSSAMAWQLGLDRATILEIGLGGLLHDIGMLRVPQEIRMAARPLTSEEWAEIYRHPLHTLDMLADLKGIPLSTKFIAYQAHERINGQGYPRGRIGDQIHRAAQIVSIADTFVALTSERPYRHALSHYQSAKTILLSGQTDHFDRNLIRAFLDTVSLFPIGSRVELSDGRSARVLRANPGRHTHPVVEEITDDGYLTGHIIDLAKERGLNVVDAF